MLYINDSLFGAESFPNHETIYKGIGNLSDELNVIKLKFEGPKDISDLEMAVAYIRDKAPESSIALDMPYIPYSAMDREIGDQLFSLHHFANVINDMHFEYVRALDPHNMDEAYRLINNLELHDLGYYIDKVINEVKPQVILYPDKGATNKYNKILNTHGIPTIYGIKHRDTSKRGRLSDEYELVTNGVELGGKSVLIIDDICRYGGTFIRAAKALRNAGVSEVYLHISHCEECATKGELFTSKLIDCVYTNDSEPAITYYSSDLGGEIENLKIIE